MLMSIFFHVSIVNSLGGVYDGLNAGGLRSVCLVHISPRWRVSSIGVNRLGLVIRQGVDTFFNYLGSNLFWLCRHTTLWREWLAEGR